MPKVTYVEFDGTRHEVDVPLGENVMRGALYNDLPGIAGECGGACSCATCHCYVDAAWTGAVGGPVSEAENELLQAASAEVRPESRLSCQICVTAEMDGLIVHLPPHQY